MEPLTCTEAPNPSPTAARFEALPTEQLEAWICQMSANLAAAEYEWLIAIAEFDARNGWHAWGVASCAHWLSWQVGLEHRTAREKLRVGHALRRFPLIGAAMASGQLSYSKARAITRIATDDNEAALTMWALAATSNQVERIVSAYSRSVRAERGRNEQQWAGRALHHRTDDDGSIVITLRLPADAGVEFLSAVEQFVAPSAPLDDGTREPLSARRADAAAHMARVAHATAHAPAHATTGAAPPLVTLHVDLDALCSDTEAEPDTGTEAPRTCHIDGAPSATPHPHSVSPATALRLLCGADLEALLQQAEHAVGVTDRTALVRGRLRRHILLRDGTCRYPDCGRAAALDIHHIIHRHHGGSNHTSNLVSLCAYHHRLVHEGGWSIEGSPDTGALTFTSPTGHQVSSEPASGPEGESSAIASMGRTADDGRCQWQGDRLDLDLAVLMLHELGGSYGPRTWSAPRSTDMPTAAAAPPACS